MNESLLVVLIPDEFQVNDGLYKTILKSKKNPGSYDRDYPQKQILEYCGHNNIKVLDLLDTLREHQKSGRVYHLQDTHWNSRGNKIAGEAISAFILNNFIGKM